MTLTRERLDVAQQVLGQIERHVHTANNATASPPPRR